MHKCEFSKLDGPVKKCNARVSYVAKVCKGHRQDNLPPEFNFDREITYHLHIVYMLVLVLVDHALVNKVGWQNNSLILAPNLSVV